MAEYMDYNSGDEPKTKRKKVVSGVVLGFSILWLVVLIGWIFLYMPKTTRSQFESVSTKDHAYTQKKVSENEFSALNDALLAKKGPIAADGAFKAKYPEVFKVLTADPKTFSSSKTKQYDTGDAVILAMPYSTSRYEKKDKGITMSAGENGLDVLVVPYTCAQKKEDGQVVSTLSIGSLQRFSFRYQYGETATPVLNSYAFDAQRYRLNFYTLSLDLNARGKIEDVTCRFPLASDSRSLSKMKELAKDVYLKNSPTSGGMLENAQEGAKSFAVRFGGGMLSEKGGSDSRARLCVKFDDLMYENFSGMEIVTRSKSEKGSFAITIN